MILPLPPPLLLLLYRIPRIANLSPGVMMFAPVAKFIEFCNIISPEEDSRCKFFGVNQIRWGERGGRQSLGMQMREDNRMGYDWNWSESWHLKLLGGGEGDNDGNSAA